MNRRTDHGQSMVEFALMLPVLLLLVFGFLDLGRAVYSQSVVANAAREGARAAVIHDSSNADIRTAVKANAIGIAVADADITINPGVRRVSGQQVSVQVTTRFYAITPFVTQLMNGGAGYLDLASTAIMIVE
jgi:Flp pilus assembly protein TadG